MRWAWLLIFSGCATPRATLGPDLDARLERIAGRAVDSVVHGGPVPVLAPTSLDPLPEGLEEVHFESRDGLRLRAWLVTPKEPIRATVVVLPGWGSSIEFALDQTNFLPAQGYRLLLLDPRANSFRGKAETFKGFLDEDLADIDVALDWVANHRPAAGPTIVYGFSWGGLKAVLAGARHAEVAAIIADAASRAESPFLRAFTEYAPPAVREDEAIRQHYLRLVATRLQSATGARLESLDVLRAVASVSPRPLLIIHSTDDGFVPFAASERLFAAAREPRTFLRGTNFGHGLGMRRVPATYCPAVLDFLDSVTRPSRRPESQSTSRP